MSFLTFSVYSNQAQAMSPSFKWAAQKWAKSAQKSASEKMEKQRVRNQAAYTKSAEEQRETLWEGIRASTYAMESDSGEESLPTKDALSTFESLGRLTSTKIMKEQMFASSAGPYPLYSKATHSRGIVAQARLVITNKESPYTGIFRDGGTALLRLSVVSAKNKTAWAPSLAFKVFIDGQSSINFGQMQSGDGRLNEDGSPNHFFFELPFSNMPGPGRTNPAAFVASDFQTHGGIFTRVAQSEVEDKYKYHYEFVTKDCDELLRLPVFDAAQMTSSGDIVQNAHAPYEVLFVASNELRDHYNTEMLNNGDQDFREILAHTQFKKGTVLFEVYGRERDSAIAAWKQNWGNKNNNLLTPKHLDTAYDRVAKDNLVLLGEVRSESEFLASEFGDTMGFPHMGMEKMEGKCPHLKMKKVQEEKNEGI